MNNLRQKLEQQLAEISGLELSLYKDTDLLCMQFNGKEIAHFHNGLPELDTRIPQKFAKRHQLGEPYRSTRHPNRSKNSIWRILTYNSEQDVDDLVVLIKKLLAEEY